MAPIHCVEILERAFNPASQDRPFGPMPEWYADFEKQYNGGAVGSKRRARRATPVTALEG
jgi:hypothetical protein